MRRFRFPIQIYRNLRFREEAEPAISMLSIWIKYEAVVLASSTFFGKPARRRNRRIWEACATEIFLKLNQIVKIPSSRVR